VNVCQDGLDDLTKRAQGARMQEPRLAGFFLGECRRDDLLHGGEIIVSLQPEISSAPLTTIPPARPGGSLPSPHLDHGKPLHDQVVRNRRIDIVALSRLELSERDAVRKAEWLRDDTHQHIKCTCKSSASSRPIMEPFHVETKVGSVIVHFRCPYCAVEWERIRPETA
jgi:hypothetical protein